MFDVNELGEVRGNSNYSLQQQESESSFDRERGGDDGSWEFSIKFESIVDLSGNFAR
jgi:hypothetical protein